MDVFFEGEIELFIFFLEAIDHVLRFVNMLNVGALKGKKH